MKKIYEVVQAQTCKFKLALCIIFKTEGGLKHEHKNSFSG